jgi:hypothetical protein
MAIAQVVEECTPRAIPNSIADLSFSVNNLEIALNSLHDQLSKVLDPENLCKGEGAGGVSSAVIPYATEIANLSSRIRSATELINDIRTRLHV